MFQWTLIFAVIAIASNFVGMNDAADLSTLIASILLVIGSFFYLTTIFTFERKVKSRRA